MITASLKILTTPKVQFFIELVSEKIGKYCWRGSKPKNISTKNVINKSINHFILFLHNYHYLKSLLTHFLKFSLNPYYRSHVFLELCLIWKESRALSTLCENEVGFIKELSFCLQCKFILDANLFRESDMWFLTFSYQLFSSYFSEQFVQYSSIENSSHFI